MRVHFVAVSEKSGKYLNMVKLLLYSFRKNGGIYKNAPFTIVTNGICIPEDDILTMKKRFPPLHVRTMPRLKGPVNFNMYNAYYAVDESTFDVLVILDCDTIILHPLDDIAIGLDGEKPFFKAMKVGRKGYDILGYENLIKTYAGLTEKELRSYKDISFIPEYPLFNAGVQVITRKAVLAMRDDIVKIAYDLDDNRVTRHSRRNFFQIRYYRLLLKMRKKGRFKNIVDRLVYLQNIALYTPYSNQPGLALSLIKNRVPFEILDKKFNWLRLLEDGSLPSIFHYLQPFYNFDRSNLFKGNWIEMYSNSNSPTERALANIVKSYNFEYQK